MDFYRFGTVCFLALWSFSLTSSMPVTQEKEGRFLDFEKLFSDPNTQIAALAGLGVVALAANNVLSGMTESGSGPIWDSIIIPKLVHLPHLCQPMFRLETDMWLPLLTSADNLIPITMESL